MYYEMAPLEGITTYIYRNAYAHCFGHIDTYYTPFIASKKMNSKELRDVLPEHNEGIEVIPQILANKVDVFLSIARKLSSFGYQTVNLNLGCPSGTVTARNRGSGFLSVPDELDAFLAEIFEKCPLDISIKTRIGVSDVSEWEHILEIYKKYPVKELIIHTRLQKEFYKGTPHMEAYQKAADMTDFLLCYNGDITSEASLQKLTDTIPDISHVMIGRGLIQDPGLVCRLKGLPAPDVSVYQEFFHEVLDGYCSIMSGDQPVLFKMKDIWTYFSRSFTNPDKYLKQIRKSRNINEYQIAVDRIFHEQKLNV